MADRRFDDAIERVWDAGLGDRPAASAGLDPALVDAVRRLRAMDRVPPPDPAFVRRTRNELMRSDPAVHRQTQEAIMRSLATSASLAPALPPHLGGLAPASGARSARPRRWSAWGRSPGGRFGSLATAALVLVALLGSVVLFNGRRPIVAPGVATPVAIADAGVTMFRANPARTGVMPGPGPTTLPGIRWRSDVLEPGPRLYSSPAVANGLIYVASTDLNDSTGALYALDSATGEERWRFDTPTQTMAASPAVVDGVVYMAADDGLDGGVVYALDAATGTERWQADTTGGRTWDGPVVAAGTVYVSTGEAVVALDAATGEERWRLRGQELLHWYNAVAVADGTVYVAAEVDEQPTGVALALDAATGEVRWLVGPDDRGTYNSVSVVDGLTFFGVGSNYRGGVLAVDAETGGERWWFDAEAAVRASPAVADGILYAGTMDAVEPPTLHALDAATGTARWSATTDGISDGEGLHASPALVDGVVYAASGCIYSDCSGSYQGAVYAFDAETGAERWQLELPDRGGVVASPAVVDGVLYVARDDGRVYALADD